jgi:hypothetical protein
MTFDQPKFLGDLLENLWNALNSRGYLVTIAVHWENELALKRYNIGRMVNNVNFINLVRTNSTFKLFILNKNLQNFKILKIF